MSRLGTSEVRSLVVLLAAGLTSLRVEPVLLVVQRLLRGVREPRAAVRVLVLDAARELILLVFVVVLRRWARRLLRLGLIGLALLPRLDRLLRLRARVLLLELVQLVLLFALLLLLGRRCPAELPPSATERIICPHELVGDDLLVALALLEERDEVLRVDIGEALAQGAQRRVAVPARRARLLHLGCAVAVLGLRVGRQLHDAEVDLLLLALAGGSDVGLDVLVVGAARAQIEVVVEVGEELLAAGGRLARLRRGPRAVLRVDAGESVRDGSGGQHTRAAVP